jgi:hypothetical protein
LKSYKNALYSLEFTEISLSSQKVTTCLELSKSNKMWKSGENDLCTPKFAQKFIQYAKVCQKLEEFCQNLLEVV